MDFCNFIIYYVFKAKETISRKFTKPPCSDALENPGPLPVLQVFKGTDDWVLWIFVVFISCAFEVEESIFVSFAKLLCSGDLENPGQLRFNRCSKVLMIGSYEFS